MQPRSPNGRFCNADGSMPHRLRDVFRWAVIDRVLRRRRRSPDRAPVRRVASDAARLDTPPRPGEGARLTWIGHASWLVQLDGMSLLVDPVLSSAIPGRIRRNVPPGLDFADLPRIDAQLVSHGHYDHLDLPTLKRIGAPVIGGLGLARALGASGLECAELAWWSAVPHGPVTITFVPAQHWSRRGLRDTNRTLWGGFVIAGSSASVYFAGDTAHFSGFAQIGRAFPGLDAAMLPIGGYDPSWFMEKHHLNPEQAVRAFLEIGARMLLAMHWGTFKLTDEPLAEPPERLEAEWTRRGLPRERLGILAVGETVQVRAG